MADTIALFPLDYVLLPGVALPLHIFEPRYRQLVADIGPRGSFGVVLGHPGVRSAAAPIASALGVADTGAGESGPADVAPRPDLADVGTVAEVIEQEAFVDGRYDLLTAGTRRFRILEVDTASKPYLQARVEYLDEPVGVDVDPALNRARSLSDRYVERLAELVDRRPHEELADEPVCASYEVAARLQLTTSDRQSLLAIESAADRLRAEVRLLRRELALLAAIQAVPVPAQALYLSTGAN